MSVILEGETGRAGDRGPGLSTLLRAFGEQCLSLARSQVTLTALELGDAARGLGRASAYAALGVVLVLLGALGLLAGVVLLIGDQWLPADRYWLGALVVLVVAVVVAAWFARRGAVLVSPSSLAPAETVATLREDSEWLRRRLT